MSKIVSQADAKAAANKAIANELNIKAIIAQEATDAKIKVLNSKTQSELNKYLAETEIAKAETIATIKIYEDKTQELKRKADADIEKLKSDILLTKAETESKITLIKQQVNSELAVLENKQKLNLVETESKIQKAYNYMILNTQESEIKALKLAANALSESSILRASANKAIAIAKSDIDANKSITEDILGRINSVSNNILAGIEYGFYLPPKPTQPLNINTDIDTIDVVLPTIPLQKPQTQQPQTQQPQTQQPQQPPPTLPPTFSNTKLYIIVGALLLLIFIITKKSKHKDDYDNY